MESKRRHVNRNLLERSDMGAVVLEKVIFWSKSVLIVENRRKGFLNKNGNFRNYDYDEWLAVMAGEMTLGFRDGTFLELRAGDYCAIAAHEKYRVESTSSEPVCVWISVQFLAEKERFW